jgi:hypothetical protein
LKQNPPSAPLLLVSAHHSDFEELVMYVRGGGEGGIVLWGSLCFFLVNLGCKFVIALGLSLAGSMSLGECCSGTQVVLFGQCV